MQEELCFISALSYTLAFHALKVTSALFLKNYFLRITVLLTASNDGKAPNFIKRAKEELEEFIHNKASFHHHHHHHHKETHGMSDDIDENTPISEVKGPNVFERAKEEIEALIQTIHPKKEC